MSKIDKNSIGVAGEHLVAAELSLNGLIATLTSKNTKEYDILVFNPSKNKHFKVQVKTTFGNNRSWPLSKKNENIISNDFYYVFVFINDVKEYYVVPSKNVSDYISKSHKSWLKKPGKKGQKHKNITLRKFDNTDEKYKNNWNFFI
jgi:hypothetical protein